MGQVIGFERFVRLIRCWYQVEAMLNIRMADHVKYHAGTTIEWCGNRFLTTLGESFVRNDGTEVPWTSHSSDMTIWY